LNSLPIKLGGEKLPPKALKIKLGNTSTISGFVNNIRNDKELFAGTVKSVMYILVGVPNLVEEPC
jgi:hypothetical protein